MKQKNTNYVSFHTTVSLVLFALKTVHFAWPVELKVGDTSQHQLGKAEQNALSMCTEDHNSSLVSAPWKHVSRWGELGAHLMVTLADVIIAAERGRVMTTSLGLFK